MANETEAGNREQGRGWGRVLSTYGPPILGILASTYTVLDGVRRSDPWFVSAGVGVAIAASVFLFVFLPQRRRVESLTRANADLQAKLAAAQGELSAEGALPYQIVSGEVACQITGDTGSLLLKKSVTFIPLTAMNVIRDHASEVAGKVTQEPPRLTLKRVRAPGATHEVIIHDQPSKVLPVGVATGSCSYTFVWELPQPLERGTGLYQRETEIRVADTFGKPAGETETLRLNLFGGDRIELSLRFTRRYIDTVLDGSQGISIRHHPSAGKDREVPAPGVWEAGEYVIHLTFTKCKVGDFVLLAWQRQDPSATRAGRGGGAGAKNDAGAAETPKAKGARKGRRSRGSQRTDSAEPGSVPGGKNPSVPPVGAGPAPGATPPGDNPQDSGGGSPIPPV